MSADERQPHAVLDKGSRMRKALKVERLLSLVTDLAGSRVLEVGTGGGYIAAHLAICVGSAGAVHAVDVVDQRQMRDGFDFQLVIDTTLPFPDDSFDVCVSNHVLEHVGDRSAQHAHLAEIRRVLRPGGWLYLAVPNRWALVEPHFRLPLLSWLPRSLRDGYVRVTGRGDRYDCDPPSHGELLELLVGSGFEAREVSLEGVKAVGEIECEPGAMRWLLRHPKLWVKPLRGILPSYIYLAHRSPG